MATQNTKIEGSTSPASPSRYGVFPGVAHLALDVADRGQSTAIAVLQDARMELRTAVEHGIELAEKLAAAAARFSKKLVARIDEAAAETITGTERVIAGAVKGARATTTAAADFANVAVSSVTASA